MMPPDFTAPSGDAVKRIRIAAALLFTTRPTDRALRGWCGAGEAAYDLEELQVTAATGEVA